MNENYSRADSDTIKEIVREAEAYIDGQVTLATSADQRASVMASVFAAAGTAIAAALMTVAAQQHDVSYAPILAGGGFAAALFIIGAAFCVAATMPVDFSLPGSQPKNWKRDLENGTPLVQSLAEQAANFQCKIDDNSKVLKRNARLFMMGAISGILAPFMGLVIWILISFKIL